MKVSVRITSNIKVIAKKPLINLYERNSKLKPRHRKISCLSLLPGFNFFIIVFSSGKLPACVTAAVFSASSAVLPFCLSCVPSAEMLGPASADFPGSGCGGFAAGLVFRGALFLGAAFVLLDFFAVT